jgi:hypothetical protein
MEGNAMNHVTRAMRHLGRLIVLTLLATRLATATASDEPLYPPYNQVYSKSGHNSFYANNVLELFAHGNQQRISDQLLHEHAGLVEFDIHKGNSGEWNVYHSYRLPPDNNTQCADLGTCRRCRSSGGKYLSASSGTVEASLFPSLLATLPCRHPGPKLGSPASRRAVGA